MKVTHHKEVTQARIKNASSEDSGVYRVKVVSSGDYAIGHIVLNGFYTFNFSSISLLHIVLNGFTFDFS